MAAIEPTQQTSADILLDKEQSLVDNLLLRFRNIIELAPNPKDMVTKEAAAANCFQMKVETDALIRSGEDLLRLSRQLKELWLAGPLRGLGEEEDWGKEGSVDADASEVMRLVRKVINSENEGMNAGKDFDGETTQK